MRPLLRTLPKINSLSKKEILYIQKTYKSDLKDVFYKMHFDPAKYLLEQLEAGSFVAHKDDKKFLSEFIRNSIGESAIIRKYLDKPSAIINDFFKEYILKPASDQMLEMRKNWNRQENITTSLELFRKNLRCGLRLLSMVNIYNPSELREKLARKHSAEIINQANKILVANIENLLSPSGVSFDEVSKIISAIPTFNSESIKDQTIENVKISDKKLGELKDQVFKKLNSREFSERLESAFSIHKQIVKSAEVKLENFKAEIEKTKDLQKNFSDADIEYEYSKLRLIYASEWIARVILLDPVSKPIISFLTEQYGVTDKVGVDFVKIMTKQVMTTAIGHGLNLALTQNPQNLDENKKHKSGYFIFCDTEAHDYMKFAIRLVAKYLLLSAHSGLNTDDGILFSKEFEEKLVSSLARFASGSHIAMRMELKENILPIFEDSVSSYIDSKADFNEIFQEFEIEDEQDPEPVIYKKELSSLLKTKESNQQVI